MKKVLITTGGTGGHIYPALALAKKLREKDVEVVFVGTKYRMEKEIIPESGFKFIGLPVKPLRRPSSFFKMFGSIIKADRIVREENPDIIIGFGNYISIPSILAGFFQRKKIYLHEQNIDLGLANKLFYRFATKTFLSFEKTYENLPSKYYKRLVVTGNPIREEFYTVKRKEERAHMKFETEEKMLLVIGGSLGAKSINDAVLKNWDRISKETNLRVYWATGKNNFDEINEKITKLKKSDVIKPYFDKVPQLMAAADMVMCRAGASTIAELIVMEKPAVLIPYDFVGQDENARLLKDNGAALVYSNEELDIALDAIFEVIYNKEYLQQMQGNIRSLKNGNAVEKIIAEIDIWRSI